MKMEQASTPMTVGSKWGEDTSLIARHPQPRYLVRLTREVRA